MTHILEQVRQHGAPVLDGNTATFVWQGARPPVLRGDWNDWNAASGLAWQRLRKPRGAVQWEPIWTARLELLPDTYMEYCFGTDEERLNDPLNRRRVSNGMGKYNNWFTMPEASFTPLAQPVPDVPQGELIALSLPTQGTVAGQARSVTFYRPPVPGPVPLLLVYDGPDYLRRARLPMLLDNLLAQGRIRPLAVAFVANGRSARMAEYGGSDGTITFVREIVLPAARQQLALTTEPGDFGVLGASMGGLMALYTGLRLPQLFGHVLSQSGAFHLDDYPTSVLSLVADGPRLPLRIWLDVGRYEWLLASNRTTHDLLAARGYDVTYREYSAGHNYTAWRNDLWRGLEALFPPRPAS